MTKILIASDIHGSEYYCKKLLERFYEEGAEYLFILGDVLYHGPRNDLPRDYAPKGVIALLNPIAEKIIDSFESPISAVHIHVDGQQLVITTQP